MVEGAAGLNRPHMVHLLQLTSWPLQGLPHPTAILSLIEQLTSTQMKCGNRRTVIMCRYGEDVCVWWSDWTSEVCVLVSAVMEWVVRGPSSPSTARWRDSRQRVWSTSSRPSSQLDYRDLASSATLWVNVNNFAMKKRLIPHSLSLTPCSRISMCSVTKWSIPTWTTLTLTQTLSLNN